jgi:hypothetical protein
MTRNFLCGSSGFARRKDYLAERRFMSDKELASELEEVRKKIEQARSRLDDLEKRLYISFEKWLKRLEQEK